MLLSLFNINRQIVLDRENYMLKKRYAVIVSETIVFRMLFLPILTFFIRDLSDNAARIACRNYIIRDIFTDDRAGTNHHIISDGNAWANAAMAANPNVITDLHRLATFQTTGTYDRINRVRSSIDADIRCKHDIVSNGHIANIQNITAIVCVKVLSYSSIDTKVTMERRLDIGAISGGYEEFL